MTGLAVVGAGNWGKNLVRNFASLGDVELKYVCDRIETVRESMTMLYPQAAVTDDYQRLLDDDSVDAIVVAVDAPRHFEMASAAYGRGDKSWKDFKPFKDKHDEERHK